MIMLLTYYVLFIVQVCYADLTRYEIDQANLAASVFRVNFTYFIPFFKSTLFFLFYINDLIENLECFSKLYADDASLFVTVEDL